jgi:hypothetical protein
MLVDALSLRIAGEVVLLKTSQALRCAASDHKPIH